MLGSNQQSISSQLSEVSRSAPPAASMLQKLCLDSVWLSQPFLLHLNLLPDPLYLEVVEPLQVPWIHPPVSSKSIYAPGRHSVDLTAGADYIPLPMEAEKGNWSSYPEVSHHLCYQESPSGIPVHYINKPFSLQPPAWQSR